MRRAAALLLLLGGLAAPALAETEVDLELILLADGSGSIDHDEFTLQRRGYARALRDPRVVDAIRAGRLGRIALAYVEWSGPALQVPIVPWRTVAGAADLEEFAAVLDNHQRELYGGGTAIGDAILYGVRSIADNEFDGARKVIDISGDGPDRNGLPAVIGRDEAVKQGLTVNGLAIIEGGYPLDEWFRDNVIGGFGAFVVPATGFADFETAVRIKLIREIAGRSMDGRDSGDVSASVRRLRRPP